MDARGFLQPELALILGLKDSPVVPYASCPKCRHSPLPEDQALPAACPACGRLAHGRGEKLD